MIDWEEGITVGPITLYQHWPPKIAKKTGVAKEWGFDHSRAAWHIRLGYYTLIIRHPYKKNPE